MYLESKLEEWNLKLGMPLGQVPIAHNDLIAAMAEGFIVL